MFKFWFCLIIIVAVSYVPHASAATLKNGSWKISFADFCSKLWSMKERLFVSQLWLMEGDATALSAVLRREFFTTATGQHYRFLPDDKADKERHRIASTVAQLWLSLRFGERMDAIIENETLEIAKTIPKNVNAENLKGIANSLYSAVRRGVQNDHELNSEYEKLATKYDPGEDASVELVAGVADKCREGVLTYWNASSTFRKFFVNKLFLKQLTADKPKSDVERRYSEMARLMVQMATNSTSKVQDVYDETIQEVANESFRENETYPTYDWIHEPLNKSPTGDVTPVLFTKLEKKLRNYLV